MDRTDRNDTQKRKTTRTLPQASPYSSAAEDRTEDYLESLRDGSGSPMTDGDDGAADA
jgi:hypothetical protein